MKDYSFGNYICALRTGLGLSQFQLGTLVGVSDKAVSKWENGDAKPRVGTCYRLAEVLGVTVNELLSCENNNKIPTRRELDNMNNRLWNEAFERLSIFGDDAPALCYSRLSAEKLALYETDAVQSFAVLGKINEAVAEFDLPAFAISTVSSSFAAWLMGATKVNPLPAHYRCPKCGKADFFADIACGFDLPSKRCDCGEDMVRDGHNIPFEGFANSEHRRTAVEIRVSEKTKPVAISTIQDFYKGIAEILTVKLVSPDGHPSSIEKYVVLDGRRPRPTTHEDGSWHVSPEEFWEWWSEETTYTVLCSHELQKIHLLREKTHQKSPDPVQLATPQMAEQLYQKKREKSAYITGMTDMFGSNESHDFDMLMRIQGFSYGSAVWSEFNFGRDKKLSSNGESLVAQGRASFRDIPAFREDVWNDISVALTRNGIRDNGLALQMMEDVRLGRYFYKGMPKEYEEILHTLGLPEWYSEYLKKVMYLFPKGHCVSLMILDMILEWYKQQYPLEYAVVSKTDNNFEAI